jgi:hypothetical protein
LCVVAECVNVVTGTMTPLTVARAHFGNAAATASSSYKPAVPLTPATGRRACFDVVLDTPAKLKW